MTLVSAAACKDSFVVMTSDSIIVTQFYDPVTLERLDDMGSQHLGTIGEKGKNKVIRLTDYVLMGMAGVSDLAWDVQQEIQSRVRPDYDLKDCLRVARESITDLRSSGDIELRDFLDVTGTGLGIIMTGFYKTNGTGLAIYGSGPDGGYFAEQKSSENTRNGYICSMIPPILDYKKYLMDLFELPPGRPITAKTVTDQMASIQYAMYTNHPDLLTSDMHVHTLFKPVGHAGGKKKKGKKGKVQNEDALRYKYFVVETNPEAEAEPKVIKKDPPGEDAPKIQQDLITFSKVDLEYASICQSMVGDLGKLTMNLGAAMELLNVDKMFKAIGEYIGEVKKLDEKFSLIEPSEIMRFYQKDFRELMDSHLKLSSVLYYSRISTGQACGGAIAAAVENIGKAAAKVTVATKNNTAE